jgi:hypothetical protein
MDVRKTLREVVTRAHPITVRGAFYRAVSTGLYPDTDGEQEGITPEEGSTKILRVHEKTLRSCLKNSQAAHCSGPVRCSRDKRLRPALQAIARLSKVNRRCHSAQLLPLGPPSGGFIWTMRLCLIFLTRTKQTPRREGK